MKPDSNTDRLPSEIFTEMTAVVGDLDHLIEEKVRDLEAMRALMQAVLENMSAKDIVQQQIAGLAQSSREAYLALRRTRDRLMELQGAQDDRSLARTDLLTGLPNAPSLMATLSDRSNASNQALLIIEMPGIRVIADELGVKVARRVICRAEAIIRRTVKERDVVARVAPHTFAVLLQNFTVGKAAVVGVRLFETLAQRLSPSGANIVDALVLAVGMTVRLSSSEDPESFFDRAMSAVKEARTLASPRICVM